MSTARLNLMVKENGSQDLNKLSVILSLQNLETYAIPLASLRIKIYGFPDARLLSMYSSSLYYPGALYGGPAVGSGSYFGQPDSASILRTFVPMNPPAAEKVAERRLAWLCLVISFTQAAGNLAANGGSLHGTQVTFERNSNQLNEANRISTSWYTRQPSSSTVFVNDSHFVLEQEVSAGVWEVVKEFTDSTTEDPNTGVSPDSTNVKYISMSSYALGRSVYIEKGLGNPFQLEATDKDSLFVKSWGNSAYDNIRRSLIKFDISDIPAGATILSAMLGVSVYDLSNTSGATKLVINPLTRAFDPNNATWYLASTGVSWSTPGGDFDAAYAINSPFVPPPDMGGGEVWADFDVTETVKAWKAGTMPNHGFLLKFSPTAEALVNNTKLVFRGSANAGDGLPEGYPRLFVSYSISGQGTDPGVTGVSTQSVFRGVSCGLFTGAR